MTRDTPTADPRNVVPYREPPRVVVDVLDAPPTPWMALSPDASWMLFVEHAAMPSLADVARPMTRVAGLRLDPTTDARHQTAFGTGLVLRDLAGTRERRVDLPTGGRISSIRWSHDSRRFACLFVGCDGNPGTSLWTADVDDAEFRRVVDGVNVVLSDGYEWMPDGVRLLVTLVPRGRGPAPTEPPIPRGPKVLEARGDTTPLRTYQDLLTGEHDERTLDHYATSELALCDPRDGSVQRWSSRTSRSSTASRSESGSRHEHGHGRGHEYGHGHEHGEHGHGEHGAPGGPRRIWGFDASPDGEWVLVTTIERPFSYLHPFSGFPQSIECWSVDGSRSRVVVRVPVAENIPIEGVRTGPRHVVWSAHGAGREAVGATLTWLEALDGGDPRVTVPHRDRWMELDAPFDGAPREILRVQHRASGLSWTHDPAQRLVRDYDRDRRWTRLRLVRLGDDPAKAITLDDRSARDRYGDPGSILFEPAARGRRVVRQRGEWICRFGDGDSPTGPRPFCDRQSLTSLEKQRLFESGADEIESPASWVEDARGEPVALVTRHESAISPPNLRLRRWSSADRAFSRDTFEALTHFGDPAPILRRVRRESLVYDRADGVTLSGELYLPPDWRGERLPIVLWAYPHDYVDPGTASQVTAGKNRFTRVAGPSQIFFALMGYAVLDDASMPIVGDPETMNDTFLEQAVSSARAAIDRLDAMGVGDRTRVGVGGHSYGAFMTACLLAHSDLFSAGIARSGAYNRTLTPFGFQAERRTLWEARESYLRLSPFLSAHTIRAPLLIVHGERDENPGTHYLQSERLFHAIKGTGGHARFVSLPHEGHGYRARESILHVLAEQIAWFDEHVANRTPHVSTSATT